MSDIKQELDKIRGRISEPSFLKNEGLSNEVAFMCSVMIRQTS